MARFRSLFILFFLSGISGLIYESIWSRYIRLFVGSAATAQILVLSLFMGGMSLGALLAGKKLANLRTPIRMYGFIEGAIGIYALLFPLLNQAMTRLCYDVLFPALGRMDLIQAIPILQWTFAGLLILPPCIFLGMTFPLMSAGILRQDRQHSGAILSLLYFSNSLGAALGAVLSGFVLVANFGLPGTLMVAAFLNLAIMAVALRHRQVFPAIQDSQSMAATTQTSPRARWWSWVFLSLAFATGCSSFMYEIGWIRLLSMIIGSATHSFEVMLSTFIFGLACGGFWMRKRMDKLKHPEFALGLIQLAMGFFAVATLPMYRLAVFAMSHLLSTETHTPEMWLQFNGLRYALCLLIMFPATFCAGMTLPLLTHILLKRGQAERAIGNVYGFNTLGSIVGAVLAGMVLLPLIGLQNVILVGAAIDIGFGLVLVYQEKNQANPYPGAKQTLVFASVGSALTLALGMFAFQLDPMVLSSTVFRHGRTRLADDYKIVSYVDGRSASVSVVKREEHPGYRVIYTNGKPDASLVLDRYPAGRDPQAGPDIAGDEPNQILVGLIPLMSHPQAKQVALIGFGSGVTCHVLLGSPNLEHLDTIEIEPEMYRGSREFMAVNYRAYEDPRNHMHFDDAKAYFAGAMKRYDLIVSEPTNPWVSGVANLFTHEFYHEVIHYLNPDGIFAQWLQGYELSDELVINVLAALDRQFFDYQIIRIGDSDWVILASASRPLSQLDPAPLQWNELQQELKVLGIHDIGQVDGLIVANKRILHPFLTDKAINSDNYPLLDLGAEKARFLRQRSEFLHRIRWTPAPVLPVLGQLMRRPYPEKGIGDLREPHVFYELERAALLMRTFHNPAEVPGEDLSNEAMHLWLEAQKQVDEESPDWLLWWQRTYEVYEQTAAHLQLRSTDWWAQVMSTAQESSVPPHIRHAIDFLDVLQSQDETRLHAAIHQVEQQQEQVLPTNLLSIARLIALELAGKTSTIEIFPKQMPAIKPEQKTSEEIAFEVFRAYAAQVEKPESLRKSSK